MQEQTSPAPRPFWHRLNTFFAFPFQLQPLGYAVLLALSSLLFHVVFFLPQALVLLLVELGIILAASRYGFKVMALGARGIVRASDFPRNLEDEWTNLPWKLFALVVLQGVVAGLVGAWSQALGYVALFVLSFTLPATTMVLVQSGSFWQALNPGYVWETMRAVGWPYALLCIFLFLLNSGAQIAIVMLLPVMSGWIALPAVNFVMIYFSWVMASLLGYVMYQNHAALGIELLPGAGADDRADRHAHAGADRATDHRLAGGADGDRRRHRRRAGDGLRRAAHAAGGPGRAAPLPPHPAAGAGQDRDAAGPRAALDRDAGGARPHFGGAQGLQGLPREGADFVLEDPLGTMALARAEWRNGEPSRRWRCCRGFDKRFRGHTAIPQAYELAARVLVQGLNRRDMAQPILTTLEARYPESEQTQEVRWLLREVPQG